MDDDAGQEKAAFWVLWINLNPFNASSLWSRLADRKVYMRYILVELLAEFNSLVHWS